MRKPPLSVHTLHMPARIFNPVGPPSWLTENFRCRRNGEVFFPDAPSGLSISRDTIAWPVRVVAVPVTSRRSFEMIVVEVYTPATGERWERPIAGATTDYPCSRAAYLYNVWAHPDFPKIAPPPAENDPDEFVSLMDELGVVLVGHVVAEREYQREFYRAARQLPSSEDAAKPLTIWIGYGKAA